MLRLFAALPVLLATGCYTSFEIETDADTPVVPLDAGVTPVVDSGDTPVEPVDSGIDDPDPALCGTMVPPYDGPGCRDDTLDCLMSCDTDDCQSRCFDADPDCGSCLNLSIVHCGNREGCQPAWDEITCCADEASPACRAGIVSGDFEACVMECLEPFDLWGSCFERVGAACTMEAVGGCFR